MSYTIYVTRSVDDNTVVVFRADPDTLHATLSTVIAQGYVVTDIATATQ